LTLFTAPLHDDGRQRYAASPEPQPEAGQPVGWTRQATRLKAAGIFWLAMTVLLLFTAPRLGVKFGPLPVYAIDFPAAVAFICAVMLPARFAPPPRFLGFVGVLVVFVIVGELAAIAYFGTVLEPVYALARMLIAISVFYSAAQLVRTSDDLKPILMAAVVGLVVTSSTMIFTSLPMTRGIAESYMTIKYLEPAAEGYAQKYGNAGDEGMRGRSLIGVSIMSGVFINVMLSLALMLLRWPGVARHWRLATLTGFAIAPLGVLVSWSRGAILGLLLVIGVLVTLGAGRVRGLVIAAVVLTGGVILWIGPDSDLLMVDRLERRTVAAVTNPYEDGREWERILAYIEPFEHLAQNPQFFLVGEGSISHRLSWDAQLHGKASHAIFAKGYYAYGLVAGFMYAWMPFMMLLYLIRARTRLGVNSFARDYATALIVATVALTPWFAFGHAAISEARGAMLAFLVLGLVASLRNLMLVERSNVRAQSPAVFDRPAKLDDTTP